MFLFTIGNFLVAGAIFFYTLLAWGLVIVLLISVFRYWIRRKPIGGSDIPEIAKRWLPPEQEKS